MPRAEESPARYLASPRVLGDDPADDPNKLKYVARLYQLHVLGPAGIVLPRREYAVARCCVNDAATMAGNLRTSVVGRHQQHRSAAIRAAYKNDISSSDAGKLAAALAPTKHEVLLKALEALANALYRQKAKARELSGAGRTHKERQEAAVLVADAEYQLTQKHTWTLDNPAVLAAFRSEHKLPTGDCPVLGRSWSEVYEQLYHDLPAGPPTFKIHLEEEARMLRMCEQFADSDASQARWQKLFSLTPTADFTCTFATLDTYAVGSLINSLLSKNPPYAVTHGCLDYLRNNPHNWSGSGTKPLGVPPLQVLFKPAKLAQLRRSKTLPREVDGNIKTDGVTVFFPCRTQAASDAKAASKRKGGATNSLAGMRERVKDWLPDALDEYDEDAKTLKKAELQAKYLKEANAKKLEHDEAEKAKARAAAAEAKKAAAAAAARAAAKKKPAKGDGGGSNKGKDGSCGAEVRLLPRRCSLQRSGIGTKLRGR
jgi:hypothetical protein